MDRIESAFTAMPRERFLPPRERHRARYDGPLRIGHGQTNSQPRTVADMLTLLDVSPGDRVLDVGSGSGWTTALLAFLTGPLGRVDGVEIVAPLASFGAANLACTLQPWAQITLATLDVLGLPARAPYDKILVSASAPRLPGDLVAQLADPGTLVIPVRTTMLQVVLCSGSLEITEHGRYRFVPLL